MMMAFGAGFHLAAAEMAKTAGKIMKALRPCIRTGSPLRELFYLGFKYEMFSQLLFGYWNEAMIKALLMQEKLLEAFHDAQFDYDRGGNNSKYISGECDIKLYETAVVVAPKSAEIIRIPYSFIESCHLADYKITIKSHLGEILQITRRVSF